MAGGRRKGRKNSLCTRFRVVPRVKRKRGFREVNSQPGARRVAPSKRCLTREGRGGQDARKEKGGRRGTKASGEIVFFYEDATATIMETISRCCGARRPATRYI